MATTTKTKTVEQITATDLKARGFKHDTTRDAPGNWYARGHVRVVLGGEEGVEVFAFDPQYPNPVSHGVLDWDARFSGGTPADVVFALFAKVFP